jgi:ABC-type dipeptide transport system, periplasmic component
VDASGDHDGDRPPVDHQHDLRLACQGTQAAEQRGVLLDAGCLQADFAKWNYNQAKAFALLKNHCTGGPSAPDPNTSAVWTCSGYPAEYRFSWTSSNQVRATQGAIIAAQLKAIGIKVDLVPRASNVFFGQYVSTGDYDLVDFAWVSGDGDPSGYFTIWSCGGDSNYLHYCSARHLT